MKNIYIATNPQKDVGYSVTSEVCRLISDEGGRIYMSKIHEASGIDCTYTECAPQLSDMIIVIGGDGSFIDASTDAISLDIPIIGVNMGRVGYLNEISVDDLAALKKIFTGEYKIKNKLLLTAEIYTDEGTETVSRLAVNDVVISHSEYLGISDFVMYSNDGGVRYRADGIVISTPAGSTAYSLSSGGPVVSHSADVMIATPIAPHSFFNRSIVFSAGETVKIKNTGSDKLNITVDGRLCANLPSGGKCKIGVSDKRMKVMTFKENNMFSNLFGKMQIVEDVI